MSLLFNILCEKDRQCNMHISCIFLYIMPRYKKKQIFSKNLPSGKYVFWWWYYYNYHHYYYYYYWIIKLLNYYYYCCSCFYSFWVILYIVMLCFLNETFWINIHLFWFHKLVSVCCVVSDDQCVGDERKKKLLNKLIMCMITWNKWGIYFNMHGK